jgi:hypothetical protein
MGREKFCFTMVEPQFPPKRWLTLNGLNGVLSQKMILFNITTLHEIFKLVTQSVLLDIADPNIPLDDVAWENRTYSTFKAYSQSKLANILFAKETGR